MALEEPGESRFLLTKKHARELELAHKYISAGLLKAGKQLSQFVGREIVVQAPRLDLCPIDQLIEVALGSAVEDAQYSESERVQTGIYLGMEGDIEGHFLLMLDPADAISLVEPLVNELGVSPDIHEEIIQSALGELGNITASGIFNAMADISGLRIGPSCPAVVTDMAGAILETPMLDIAQFAEESIYIDTRMEMDKLAARCTLAIIPRPEGLQRFINALTPRIVGGHR